MLSPSELTTLYTIISDETKSFEIISNIFQKTYSKSEQFKVGVTLWFLIKDNLLNLSQRLSSFYILYDMYRNEKLQSIPFIPIVLQTLNESKNKIEQQFLIDFIQNKIDYSKTPIKIYIEDNEKNQNIIIPNLEEYWNNYKKQTEKISKSINDWMRPIIYDNKDNKSNKIFNLNQLTPVEVSMKYFEPNYMSYYPNTNYTFYDDEPLWIIPTLKHNFVYDFNLTKEKDSISSILFKPFINKQINKEEEDFVMEILNKNPNILSEINFNSSKFMNLIEKNVSFATNIFLKITQSNLFQNYLNAFLKHKFTQNSMKVISNIIMSITLPKIFINSYIKHIIDNFKEENKNDEKIKLGRYIAYFINKLLDNNFIKVDDIPKEIDILFSINTEEIASLNKKIIELNQSNK
jgi:hypothetical protein